MTLSRHQLSCCLRLLLLLLHIHGVSQVLQDLALPHYHHEFVKASVELLFENPDKAAPLTGLLKQLSEQGVITSTQMAQVCLFRGRGCSWGAWQLCDVMFSDVASDSLLYAAASGSDRAAAHLPLYRAHVLPGSGADTEYADAMRHLHCCCCTLLPLEGFEHTPQSLQSAALTQTCYFRCCHSILSSGYKGWTRIKCGLADEALHTPSALQALC